MAGLLPNWVVRSDRPLSGAADDIKSPNNRAGSTRLRKVAYYWHTRFLKAARIMLDFHLNSFIIKWWAEMDSNHRRLSPADLQSSGVCRLKEFLYIIYTFRLYT